MGRRLARLSRRLYLPYAWNRKPSNEFEVWENPQIPAGYTYVAQFLAHDCVNSSIPTSALANHRLVRNGRSVAFELETLYGGGFDGCAHALAPSADDKLAPSKLQLGHISIAQSANGQCPFRDIARSKLADLDSGARGVRIADDRNDNNVLVSQITVLFTLFHNCVVDLLASRVPAQSGPARSQRFYTDLFLQAKSICVAAYRSMIEKDLMARLLHPAVYARYAAADPPFIDGNAGEEITLEFLQTLRFGHAMVRPHYRVNDIYERRESLIDVLLTTSRGRPWRLPLDETWAVDWSNFFLLSDAPPNTSRRIGPSFSTDLMSAQVFESIDETGTVGLAYRDLVSGASLRVWSVAGLVDELNARAPELVRASPLLADRQHRETVIGAWLADGAEAARLNADDIREIAADPPLLIFVLIEAAAEMAGERLGTLGSILTAETVFKALRANPVDDKAGAARLQLGAEETSGDGVPALSSMSDIVRFVHRRARLDESVVPFARLAPARRLSRVSV
jgi:Animal haem peroxidase